MPKFFNKLAGLCLITLSCKSARETTTKSPKAITSHHSDKKNHKNKDPHPNGEPPKMIGGHRALARNLHYPEEARKNRIEGTVILKFTVTKKGEVTNFILVKGIGHGCNIAAIRALTKVRFIPGKIDGKPVKVQYTWPVRFRLQ